MAEFKTLSNVIPKLVRLKPRNLLTHNYWALNAWDPAVLNNQMLLWQCERVLGEGHPSLTLLPARQAAAVGWATWDVGYEGTATLARRRHGVANAVAHCCTARCLWHTSHPDEPSITLSTQHLATAIYPREEKAAAAASRVVSSIHLWLPALILAAVFTPNCNLRVTDW